MIFFFKIFSISSQLPPLKMLELAELSTYLHALHNKFILHSFMYVRAQQQETKKNIFYNQCGRQFLNYFLRQFRCFIE